MKPSAGGGAPEEAYWFFKEVCKCLTEACWTKFLEAMLKEVARRGDLKKVMDIVSMM